MKFKLQTSIAILLVGLTLLSISALGASSYDFAQDSANVLPFRILDDTAGEVYGEIIGTAAAVAGGASDKNCSQPTVACRRKKIQFLVRFWLFVRSCS